MLRHWEYVLSHPFQQQLSAVAVGRDQGVNPDLYGHLHGLTAEILDDVLDDVCDIVSLRRLDLQLCSEKPMVVLRGLPVEHNVSQLGLLRRRGIGAITKRRNRHGATRSSTQWILRDQRIRIRLSADLNNRLCYQYEINGKMATIAE